MLGTERPVSTRLEQRLTFPWPRPLRSEAGPRRFTCWLPALLSGGLLYLCHFPVAWGWLGWVALVPLLSLVRSEARPRRVYLAAWVAGLVFFWPVLQWMRVADDRMYFTWGLLATHCSLFVPAGIAFLRQLDRRTRLPLTLTVPAVWTALEFLRAHLLTGFAWYFLGHTQHGALPLIQITDLAGAYGVTFVVAAVNAVVFEWLSTCAWFRGLFDLPERASRRPALAARAAAVLLVVAAALGYGCWRLADEEFEEGPLVALIQGNLDQRIRNEASSGGSGDAVVTMVRHYKDLSDEAAGQQPRPDLIVWPETSYPGDWAEVAPEVTVERLPKPWRDALEETQNLTRILPHRWQTNVLLGLNAATLDADEKAHRYNSAVFLQKDRTYGGRYDKMHRVPFGEYVPLREWLPFMDRFAPYDFDYSVRAGESFTRFPLRTDKDDYHFGVLICFEDTDPVLARQYVCTDGSEPAVDFVLNISNDGWFNGTSEHEEHLAICRFRAIECRRSVARAVNMGISAVIDGSGRVVALPGPTWAKSKKLQAVLTANIPIDRRISLYARWGDWLPWGCWLLIGAALAFSLRRRPAEASIMST